MTNGHTFFGSVLLAQLAENVGLHLCDIGSRGGALEDFIPAAAFTRVTGFEPDQEECERLNKAAKNSYNNWKFEEHFQIALGEKNERIDLVVCKDPFYSSTLEPVKQLPLEFSRNDEFQVVKRLHMDVESLDSFCASQSIQDMDFMKVDVQGGELAILKGAQEVVSRHLLGVRCEVEFAHLYVGQPLFSEMEMHMRELGFYPADWLYERHWRNDPRYEHAQYCKSAEIPYSRGRLIHSDVLFLRDHHWIIANMDDADTKLCRLLLIALLYHHVDLALTILPLIKANKIIKGASREQWVREFAGVSRLLGKQAFRQAAQDWFIKLRRFLRR
jgi:FkbM family methyltransferase